MQRNLYQSWWIMSYTVALVLKRNSVLWRPKWWKRLNKVPDRRNWDMAMICVIRHPEQH